MNSRFLFSLVSGLALLWSASVVSAQPAPMQPSSDSAAAPAESASMTAQPQDQAAMGAPTTEDPSTAKAKRRAAARHHGHHGAMQSESEEPAH